MTTVTASKPASASSRSSSAIGRASIGSSGSARSVLAVQDRRSPRPRVHRAGAEPPRPRSVRCGRVRAGSLAAARSSVWPAPPPPRSSQVARSVPRRARRRTAAVGTGSSRTSSRSSSGVALERTSTWSTRKSTSSRLQRRPPWIARQIPKPAADDLRGTDRASATRPRAEQPEADGRPSSALARPRPPFSQPLLLQRASSSLAPPFAFDPASPPNARPRRRR